MRIHIAPKVAALGLAVLVVGGAAGTALAATDGSSAITTVAASPVAAGPVASTTPAPAKMSMAQLTAKLGSNEKQMIIALDDMKNTVVSTPGLNAATARTVMIKVLAKDLGISGSAAAWAVDEIDGGYVVTSPNWGF